MECLLGNLVFEIFSRRILVGKVEEGRGGGIRREVGISSKRREKKFREKEGKNHDSKL